ncbi:MAG TPA: ABC transporter substrate-binding protein [Mycobacteriales bacterium]|nr:ABC transporter substrate-binding protein [Mycobacteriales bacterium]
MLAAAAAALALIAGCGTTVQIPPASPGGAESLSLSATSPSSPDAAGTHPASGNGAGATGVPGATVTASNPRGSTGPSRPVVARTASSSSRHGKSPAPTEVTGPLTIGFAYPNNAAANASLGLSTSASADPKSVMGALVAAVNKAGGLAGRKVTVDYYATSSTTSDYSTAAQAACAHFTEDQHVPVVLDLAYGNKFGMATCLARHGVADFGLATSDTVDDNNAGLFASPMGMSSTRRYPAVLDVLRTTGYLTPKNRIGVLLENCPDLRRAYDQAVRPEISRLGLDLADTAQIGCTSGFASAGPASAATQSAVLRFRSHQVDRVLIVSDFEQVALMLFANAAASQGWRPGYMLSSAAETEVMRSSISKTQWPQLHGVGWSPRLDIDDAHQPLTPADRRCLTLIKKGGIAVTGWQNTYIATMECSDLFFLEAALTSSHGDAQGSALMAAVESLGASFVSPGVLGGRTFFGPSQREGAAEVAPFGYVAGCRCLRYTGRPVATR